jgi:threonine dehydrogenase-like Zn-dependent dehydrogenase
MMRAALVAGPREVRVETVPLPEPGPGEVRLRVEGCGVCGSNLPVWQGRPWFNYPLAAGAPGHEAWGTVDAVGPGVTAPQVGERVAALSYRAYAEYDLAAADAVVALPGALDCDPFPGEALGCAVNVFRRSEISAGQTVAVVGIGFLGAVVVRLASHAGARVIAISRRRFALETAAALGAVASIPAGDHGDVVARVRALTDGAGCERVVEAVGLQRPLDLAGEITRERGRLVIAGYHQDGPRLVDMQQWNWKGLDVINAHERDPRAYVEGIRGAAEAVESGVLDPRRLCTHFYPLDQLGDALEAMHARPEGFLKAVVTP